MAKKLISFDDSKTGDAALPEPVKEVLRATYAPAGDYAETSAIAPAVESALANNQTVVDAAATAAESAAGTAVNNAASSGQFKAGYVAAISAAQRATLVENLAQNVTLSINANGYSSNAGTGGAATGAKASGAGHGGVDGYRVTWTTASAAPETSPQGGAQYGRNTVTSDAAVTAGVTYTLSMWAKSSIDQRLALRVVFYDAANAAVGSPVYSTGRIVPANTEVRLYNTVTVPAGATHLGMRVVHANGVGGVAWPVGATLTVSLPQITQGSTLWPEFTGSEPDAYWVGGKDISSSRKAFTGADGTITQGDVINSWWCLPRTLEDTTRGKFWQGGITRKGTQGITEFDTLTGMAKWHPIAGRDGGQDDHNVPAFLIESDKPPLVAYSWHNRTETMAIRRGTVTGELSSLGPEEILTVTSEAYPITQTSYAQLLRRPGTDTVALMYRAQGTFAGWYTSISTDWGVTWQAPYRLTALGYQHFTLSADGTVAHFVAADHPTNTATLRTRRFDVTLTTGAITNPVTGATLKPNFWDPATTTIAESIMHAVNDLTKPSATRLFDVSPDGTRILQMKFQTSAVGSGTPSESDLSTGVYVVNRWDGAAWVEETLCSAGRPFGYYFAFYTAGAVFGVDGSTVFLGREIGGLWTVERWTRDGSGVWSQTDVLHRAPAGRSIGRPQIPVNTRSESRVTFGEYTTYATDSFENYYGIQKLLTRP
ncbi:hypothetical protein [Rhodococcus sp. AH-ZY2]|uniref:hypothetical protein n=1 Tax=Rhodococcus sp. AH-ZY2 TaxID=3047468 RepID=UPI0027E020CB|nr:hypothetical protein [Rhodococcus sp. AH-ZY2]WML63677.1 hypothetical protein QNA09_02325 [Rhodococcus sp. AH-ZY2]